MSSFFKHIFDICFFNTVLAFCKDGYRMQNETHVFGTENGLLRFLTVSGFITLIIYLLSDAVNIAGIFWTYIFITVFISVWNICNKINIYIYIKCYFA